MKLSYLIAFLLIIPSAMAVIDEHNIEDGFIIVEYPDKANRGDFYTITIDVQLNDNSITSLELKTPETITFECEEMTCSAAYGFEMSEEIVPIWFTLELNEPRASTESIPTENQDFFFFQSPEGEQTLYNKKITILPNTEEIDDSINSNPRVEDEIIYLVNEIDRELTEEDFDKQKELAEKNFLVKKTAKLISKETEFGRQLRTEWTIKVTPNEDVLKAYNMYVYEEVPKEGAETFNEIINTNIKFSVLKEDPIIMWHFAEVDKEVEITYETSKASITGAATVVTVEEVEKGTPWQVIVPIIIIPIIAGLIIYFSRFQKK